MKPTISIIGRGNVASHLLEALKKNANVNLVNPHSPENLESSDICLICVSDNAIAEVAEKLSHLDCIIAHTSGSTSLDVLRQAGVKRPGVFYPLQTFTKNIPLTYNEIPIFIEGDTPDIEWILTDVAKSFTDSVSLANSESRRKLHLASVFACNFVNHLWAISDEILHQAGFSLSDIYPLLAETMSKATNRGAADSQTGPAARHDQVTMDAHLNLLADNHNLQNIYTLLSDSIQNFNPSSK